MISLIDGKKAVEELVKGDSILHSDGTSTPLAETPIPVIAFCNDIRTDNGHGGVVSRSHTYILERGGYEYAHSSLGVSLQTEEGPSHVNSRADAGEQRVFPLAVGGNHTYCADGIWSLE